MNMLDRLVGRLRRAHPASERPVEPETLHPARPMTSFLDGLSAEQRVKLKAYRGPESHGEKIGSPAR